MPNILMKATCTSTAPVNEAASHPDLVIANLDALVATRMRHNDETLARTLVWDYYRE